MSSKMGVADLMSVTKARTALVLKRVEGQAILLRPNSDHTEEVEILVTDVGSRRVRLLILAPRTTLVLRKELPARSGESDGSDV